MRMLGTIGLLGFALALPTAAAAVDDSVIYATKTECRAALADAREEDPAYYMRECRPEGEGWSFRVKDRGDRSTKGMRN